MSESKFYEKCYEVIKLGPAAWNDWVAKEKRAGALDLRVLTGINLNGAHLAYATLSSVEARHAQCIECDLRYAWLPNSDFSGAVLLKANLERVNARGANFRGANLGHAILVGANLSNANFTNAVLNFANLTGANLTGAVLNGASFEGAILNDCMVNDNALLMANLTGADVSGAKVRGTNTATSNLAVQTIPSDFAQRLFDEGCAVWNRWKQLQKKAVALGDLDLARRDLRGADFDNTQLHDIDFTGADLTESNFYAARLNRCTLVASIMTASNLDETRFTNSSADEAHIANAHFGNAKFQDCSFWRTNFQRSYLVGSEFMHCQLHEADFSETVVRGTSFRACTGLLVKGVELHPFPPKWLNECELLSVKKLRREGWRLAEDLGDLVVADRYLTEALELLRKLDASPQEQKRALHLLMTVKRSMGIVS